jgi:hypothetical protein
MIPDETRYIKAITSYIAEKIAFKLFHSIIKLQPFQETILFLD